MTRNPWLASLLGLTTAALLGATGCGDSTKCGAGTHAEGSTCVPDATCGLGTVLESGHCLPDGSVVCVQGTRFDAATGTCLVDPTACAEGTTLVGSVCTPDDELLQGAAGLEEAPEPNGSVDAPAGSLAAPALDASTTFYGCITPTADTNGDGNLEPDTDTWMLTASGPMVLEITTDGLRGLSAGFFLEAADPALSPGLDGWRRYGLNRTGDTARRQVYVPAAGTYALNLVDQRALFQEFAAGSADTCYFATVKQVARPAPVEATLPSTAGQDAGQVQLFTFTATGEGDILDALERSSNPAFAPAFVLLRGDALHGVSAARPTATGTEAFRAAGGLSTGDVITVVLDAEHNYAVAPMAFDLALTQIQALALPTSGGVVTATEQNLPTGPSLATLSYLYFDVATAGVVRFDLTASKPLDMMILGGDVATASGGFDVIAQINPLGGTGVATFQGEFVRFLTPGRYYFATFNPAATAAGGTFTVTATLTDVPVAALTPGTDSGTVPLTSGSAFHSIDLTDPVWLEFGVTGTTDWGVGTAVSLEAYDLAVAGWLRSGVGGVAGQVFPLFTGSQPAVLPFAPMGRILAGETRDLLLRVKPAGAPGAAPAYSLLVQDRPGVTNLGTISPGTDVTRSITALASGAPARFIAFGAVANTLVALAHPVTGTVNVRQVRLNVSEGATQIVDAGAAGADETLRATVGAAPSNWVAWTVENLTAGTPSDVSLTVSTTAPRPYVVTSGALAFADACVGGTTLGVGQDDQIFAAQTLPADLGAFQLFGEAVPATFRVSANGWLSWDTGAVSFGGYQNRRMPLAGAPEGVLAPFWQDLDTVTLCRKDDAVNHTVTYQWTGKIYQAPATQGVQFQVVMHADGVVDFIYGPLHVSSGAYDDGDGNGATVGAETLAGTYGQELVFNAPSVLPNTSYTLTPQ